MYFKKGQADIIALIFLVAISLTLVSATYFWVIPNIQEMTALNEVHRLENQMIDLNQAISQTIREKSQRSFLFRIKEGTLMVKDDRIIYRGFFTLPKSARGEEEIIYGGVNTSNYINCSEGAIGVLGEDEPVCLLKRGSVELELRYFKLNDTTTGDIYSINFVKSSNSFAGKGSHNIVLKWVNETITGTNPKNITKNIIIEIY